MNLVEDHQTDTGQLRILLQPPRQHSLGDNLDPCVATDTPFVASLVTNEATDLGPEQRRHPLSGGPGRQSPWLEHHDATGEPRLLDQPQRGDRGLAGARRRDQECRSMVLESGRQVGEDVDDGKVASRCGQHYISAECWCAVKRPRVTGNRDGRADPSRRGGDLLGNFAPLCGVPSLGAGLQRAVEADEHECR